MCGIIGYVGTQPARPILMEGLKRLEYRGYDSAGIALLQNDALEIRRAVGPLRHLEKLVVNETFTGTMGIGHTRWATHGKPSERNAHPQRSGKFAIVHNGIIENYFVLKQQLQAEGFSFDSDTDTEVAAHLLASYVTRGHSFPDAVRLMTRDLHGSFTIAAMWVNEPRTLLATRSGCPLIVGQNADGSFLASDVTPLLSHTRRVLYLEDGEIGVLTPSRITAIGANGVDINRKPVAVAWDVATVEKGDYPHFMAKEIHEQPNVINEALRGRYSFDTGDVELPTLTAMAESLAEVRQTWIVACGSSWHAGLIGKYLFEDMIRCPVQVDIASEFRYRNPLIQKGDLLIAISQSGETADTLAAVQEGKRQGACVLSIVNVVESSLARLSDGVIYTRCGPEMSVASTKAFTGQVIALYLLAMFLGRRQGLITPEEGRTWLAEFLALPGHVEHILKREADILGIAEQYQSNNNFLFLGRGIHYPVALEGALKLKEISYIHAEGYAAGEMKHGPIALLDPYTPVVVLAPHGRLYAKTMNNLLEVKAREAPIIAFVTEGDQAIGSVADAVFTIPVVPSLLSPIVFTVALQILSYHVAVLRGLNVDRPRNLAKSVTVE